MGSVVFYACVPPALFRAIAIVCQAMFYCCSRQKQRVADTEKAPSTSIPKPTSDHALEKTETEVSVSITPSTSTSESHTREPSTSDAIGKFE